MSPSPTETSVATPSPVRRYERPTTVAEVLDGLSPDHTLLAGGTDLVPLVRSRLVHPDVIVDVKSTDLDRSISIDDDAVRIGALATLAEIATDPALQQAAPVLTEAAGQAATTQLRNRATVGGNLLQEPRCEYYRMAEVECWRKGGEGCPARDGVAHHHAVFETERPCVAVHPSDPAVALVALGATLELRSTAGVRTVAVEEFLSPPTEERRREHQLALGELITAITFPPAPNSAYIKIMDRATWAFALVSVAAVIELDGATVSHSSVVAGGVAAVPRRLSTVEEAITGRGPADLDVDAAARRSSDGATPLDDTTYKLRLLTASVSDALTALKALTESPSS